MGNRLTKVLDADNHQIWMRSRDSREINPDANVVHWDWRTIDNWGNYSMRWTLLSTCRD